MSTVIRLRALWIALFFGGIATAIASFSPDRSLTFKMALLVGFGGLALFLSTEGFGQLSARRSATTRWVARIFLVLVTLQVITGLAQILINA